MKLTPKQLDALHNAKCALYHTYEELSALVKAGQLKDLKAAERVLEGVLKPYYKAEEERRKTVAKATAHLTKKTMGMWSVDEMPETPIAASGKVRFIVDKPTWSSNGKTYMSKPIANPTYADAFKAFVQSIKVTGDRHHIFFEGILFTTRKYKGARLIELLAGS